MKLSTTPRVGIKDPDLQRELREHANQVNAVSEGRIGGHYNAATAAPTTGMYQQGDFVRNLTPTELGTTPNKYIVFGWQCLVGGEPGTFVQCRFLTGN